jgi:hypothetical protein
MFVLDVDVNVNEQLRMTKRAGALSRLSPPRAEQINQKKLKK